MSQETIVESAELAELTEIAANIDKPSFFENNAGTIYVIAAMGIAAVGYGLYRYWSNKNSTAISPDSTDGRVNDYEDIANKYAGNSSEEVDEQIRRAEEILRTLKERKKNI